jgi:hypothetical protein
VVPAQGQSGGIWLFWKQDISITVVEHSPNYIFGLCNNVLDNRQFGLVCLYGDPHHQNTASIWAQVLHFVVGNSTMPIFCMGDLNGIMHPNEKLGPSRPDIMHINAFCDHVKQCGFIDLGYSGPDYT